MKHQKKLDWMARWCADHGLRLEMAGECGFGRECVGVLRDTVYPDYEWYDEDYNRIDENGEVFIPPNAYHKHPCVAVLGRGEGAEAELYDWLRWFDQNDFELEVTPAEPDPRIPFQLSVLLGRTRNVRMVRKGGAP